LAAAALIVNFLSTTAFMAETISSFDYRILWTLLADLEAILCKKNSSSVNQLLYNKNLCSERTKKMVVVAKPRKVFKSRQPQTKFFNLAARAATDLHQLSN